MYTRCNVSWWHLQAQEQEYNTQIGRQGTRGTVGLTSVDFWRFSSTKKYLSYGIEWANCRFRRHSHKYWQSLGPFYGAIAVPSVTRCRCRRCCCCGHRRAAARSGEWAQHFSNASCCQIVIIPDVLHIEFFIYTPSLLRPRCMRQKSYTRGVHAGIRQISPASPTRS